MLGLILINVIGVVGLGGLIAWMLGNGESSDASSNKSDEKSPYTPPVSISEHITNVKTDDPGKYRWFRDEMNKPRF